MRRIITVLVFRWSNDTSSNVGSITDGTNSNILKCKKLGNVRDISSCWLTHWSYIAKIFLNFKSKHFLVRTNRMIFIKRESVGVKCIMHFYKQKAIYRIRQASFLQSQHPYGGVFKTSRPLGVIRRFNFRVLLEELEKLKEFCNKYVNLRGNYVEQNRNQLIFL